MGVKVAPAALSLLVALISVTLSGCGQDFSGLFSRMSKLQVFFPGGDTNTILRLPSIVDRPVDILWVLDNKNSTNDELQALSIQAKAFSDRFLSSRNDFQMAILPSDFYLDGSPDNPSDVIGKVSVIRTQPPLGSLDSEKIKWNIDQKAAFLSQMNVGNVGSSDTRLIESSLRFMHYNETREECKNRTDVRCLFRPHTLRVIVYVGKLCDDTQYYKNPNNVSMGSYDYILGTLPHSYNDNVVNGLFMYNGSKTVWLYHRKFFDQLDGGSSASGPNYYVVGLGLPQQGSSESCSGMNPATAFSREYHIEPVVNITRYNFYSYMTDQYFNHTTNAYETDPLGKADWNLMEKHSRFYDIRETDFDQFLAAFSTNLDEKMLSLTDMPAFELMNTPSGRFSVKVLATRMDGVEENLPRTSFMIIDNMILFVSGAVIQNMSNYRSLRVEYVPESSLEAAAS